ncbi:MAG: N-acetylmuramic acid 6-phosphate etherase [Rhodococcus erythropolis]
MNIGNLGTETSNDRTSQMDTLSALELVEIMNDEDATVASAVRACLPQVAAAVDVVTAALSGGGRLIYIGAGTSGRIGLLDAVECPPTFGTSPNQVQGLLAGGRDAFYLAVEGAEDSSTLGATDIDDAEVGSADVVVGLAASGRTPYVIGGLDRARARGASTVSIACNRWAVVSTHADVAIEVDVGPEVLTGSTRLKSGTAQKMICNMLSTAAMVQLGKTYRNFMVDMRPTNAKLVDRAERIVAAATGVSRSTAAEVLEGANGQVKVAIVMLLASVDVTAATEMLSGAHGSVHRAIGPNTGRT